MNWLQNIDDNIKIIDLSIPGTHNSGAYKVNFSINTNNKYYNIAAGTYILQPWLKNWTICQDLSIKEQLNIGVRFLDIRVSKCNNGYYLSHAYICSNFIEELDNIYNFLINNPSEFIIIKFKKCPHIKHNISNQDILNVISNHSISNLMLSTISNNITVGDGRGKLLTHLNFTKLDAVWFNTSSSTLCRQKVANSLQNIPTDCLYVTNNFLTPQLYDMGTNSGLLITSIILLIIYSRSENVHLLILSILCLINGLYYKNSVKSLSKKVNKYIYNFKDTRVVMFDFIDSNMAEYVYLLNYKNKI